MPDTDPFSLSSSTPRRIHDLELPDRGPVAGLSARQADLDLLSCAPSDFLDTTHFDTRRFPPPPWAAEVFAAAAWDGSQAYSGYRGHAHVLESVARSLSGFLGHPVDPDRNLILTPGTQAGLFGALASRVESGAKVAIVDPDYLFTARILRFLGCEVVHIPLRFLDHGVTPDLEMLEREFREGGVRDFVFSHPNNPTGSVYSASVIEELRALTERYDVRVVADELYSRLLYGDVSFTHFASDSQAFKRTFTLLGPSKTESLSGYRLGVMVGPETSMRAAEDVLSITALRAPAYAQNVLVPWLRDDREWLRDRIVEFDRLRHMTRVALARLPWLRVHIQEATAYAWVDFSALDSPDTLICNALLSEARVLVSPGYQFGPSGRGHFRVCYARDEVDWGGALERMTATLTQVAAAKGLA